MTRMRSPVTTHLPVATARVCVLMLCVGIGVPAVEGQDALIGRWDFDNGTGKDLSGNGNDADLGGTRIYSLGKGRACIELMPGDKPMRIPVPEKSPLAISRGTISFWVNVAWEDGPILRYDNGAVQLNTYRGCFQARFNGEADFRYGSQILDYDWPKYDMREWAFYPHVRASVGDSEWHLFGVAYDEKGKRIIGWRDGEVISVVDLSTVKMEPLEREGLKEIVTGKGFVGYLDDLRIHRDGSA